MPPSAPSDNEVTHLLQRADKDQATHQRLFELVRGELEKRARRLLRQETSPQSLQTAVLVDDAYLALLDQAGTACLDRAHFYRLASRVMEQVLVEYARGRNRLKRDGGRRALPLDEVPEPARPHAASPGTILAVHEALQRLEGDYPQCAAIVRLRFFGGHTEDEAALALGLSRDQVKRRWQTARALLASFLAPE